MVSVEFSVQVGTAVSQGVKNHGEEADSRRAGHPVPPMYNPRRSSGGTGRRWRQARCARRGGGVESNDFDLARALDVQHVCLAHN